MPNLGRPLRRLRRGLQHLILALLFIVVVAPEWPAFQDESYRLRTVIGTRGFDFLVWEVNALALKGAAFVSGGHNFLDEATEKEFVLEFLALIAESNRLQREIALIYADPAMTDPTTVAAPAELDLAHIRAEIAARQPLAEAIIEAQVGAVLVDEGFGILGEAWPPVQMHMTPVPSLLVVSLRSRVEQVYSISLAHGLSAAEYDDLENAVYNDLELSALVVPIAGIGIYPAMIVERSDINRVMEVTAHEWAHHWLTLHPLGINYGTTPELRIINETTASVFGTEVGRLVVERFYPELAPPPPAPPPTQADDEDAGSGEPVFDSFAELGITRVEVDRLLSEGKIVEAEAYMETRRQFLWDNGYRLRKLNQAYFAFYGAYADAPGAQGSNPIGPTIVAVRADSRSLRIFMDRMAPITSLTALQAAAPES